MEAVSETLLGPKNLFRSANTLLSNVSDADKFNGSSVNHDEHFLSNLSFSRTARLKPQLERIFFPAARFLPLSMILICCNVYLRKLEVRRKSSSFYSFYCLQQTHQSDKGVVPLTYYLLENSHRSSSEPTRLNFVNFPTCPWTIRQLRVKVKSFIKFEQTSSVLLSPTRISQLEKTNHHLDMQWAHDTHIRPLSFFCSLSFQKIDCICWPQGFPLFQMERVKLFIPKKGGYSGHQGSRFMAMQIFGSDQESVSCRKRAHWELGSNFNAFDLSKSESKVKSNGSGCATSDARSNNSRTAFICNLINDCHFLIVGSTF